MKNIFSSNGYQALITNTEVYNAAKNRNETWTRITWMTTPSFINSEHLRSLFADRRSAIRYFRKQAA